VNVERAGTCSAVHGLLRALLHAYLSTGTGVGMGVALAALSIGLGINRLSAFTIKGDVA
jgi:hypothetical protein